MSVLQRRLQGSPIDVIDVIAVIAGVDGALGLAMGSLTLEVFPTRSFVAEHWRLLRPGSPAPHLVTFE